MADFMSAVLNTLKWEGSEYTDDPNDDGGGTKYGITEKYSFYRAIELGIIPRETNLKHLTEQQAILIYKDLYWNANPLISKIDNQELVNKIFDECINIGSRTAIHILQSTCNIVYKKDFKQDGKLSEELVDFINKNNDSKILKEYKENLIKYYEGIVIKNNEDKKFLKGWINRARG